MLIVGCLGSITTLYGSYIARDSVIWYDAHGGAWTFIVLHMATLGFYFGYLFFLQWTFRRDLTSFDFFMSDDKLQFNRFLQLSIKAKFYLYFGTPNILWALFLPLKHQLPINGLEFEHEYNQVQVSKIKE